MAFIVYILDPVDTSVYDDLCKDFYDVPVVIHCETKPYSGSSEEMAFIEVAPFSSEDEQDMKESISRILREKGISHALTSNRNSSAGVSLVRVEGMTCHSCVSLIETALREMEGVVSVRVSLHRKEAFIEYIPSTTSVGVLSTAIYDMGFDTDVLMTLTDSSVSHDVVGLEGISRVVVGVEGMVCMSCVNNIQSNVSDVKGVIAVNVSLGDKTATVDFEPTLITPNEIVDAINDLGFEASLSVPIAQESDSPSDPVSPEKLPSSPDKLPSSLTVPTVSYSVQRTGMSVDVNSEDDECGVSEHECVVGMWIHECVVDTWIHECVVGMWIHECVVGTWMHECVVGTWTHECVVGTWVHECVVGTWVHECVVGTWVHEFVVGMWIHECMAHMYVYMSVWLVRGYISMWLVRGYISMWLVRGYMSAWWVRGSSLSLLAGLPC